MCIPLPIRGQPHVSSAGPPALPPALGGHSPVPAWSRLLSTSPVRFWQSLTTLVNPARTDLPVLYCTSNLGLAAGLRPLCPCRRLTANAPLHAPTRGGGMVGPILVARPLPNIGLVAHFQGSCLLYGRGSAPLQFRVGQLHLLARRRVHRSSLGLECHF
jgi:hypothetical protein